MMRAKLTVESILRSKNQDQLKLRAEYSSSPEDNTYSKYTPSAEMSITITNPNLINKFYPGQEFYVDFTEIKKDTNADGIRS